MPDEDDAGVEIPMEEIKKNGKKQANKAKKKNPKAKKQIDKLMGMIGFGK